MSTRRARRSSRTRRPNGRRRHVLAWGAVDAVAPVRRRASDNGSARTTRAAGASTARAGTGGVQERAAEPYDGPALVYGSPRAPHRTGRTGRCRAGSATSRSAASTLGFRSTWPGSSTSSHWTTRSPKLEVFPNWTYGGTLAGSLRAAARTADSRCSASRRRTRRACRRTAMRGTSTSTPSTRRTDRAGSATAPR